MSRIGGDGPGAAWVARRTENTMSAGKTSVPAALATLLLISCAAPAATFEVPLTDLIGQYGAGEPTIRTSSYDFGTSFTQIDAVWMRIQGTFDGGLWHYYDLNDPFQTIYWARCSGFMGVLRLSGKYASVTGFDCDGPFDEESGFRLWGSDEYERMMTGRGSVAVEFNSPIFLAIYVVWQVEAPWGQITDARLTVEGTAIGEPILGDVNMSGCVDDDDLSLLLANWGNAPWDDCPQR